MERQRFRILFVIIVLLAATEVSPARERTDTTYVCHSDSVLINFRQSKWDLDLTLGSNASALNDIDSRLTTVVNDSVFRLRHISIFGGASPEGTPTFNQVLSKRRAETLFDWFDRYNQLSALDKTFTFLGRDWDGVLILAEEDVNIPYRDETLSLLQTIVAEKRALGGEEPQRSLERLKQLRCGVPYQYLYRNIFPQVRASKVVIDYDRILAPDVQKRKTESVAVVPDTVYIDRIVYLTDTVYINVCPKKPKKPFYMDIHSNMLYDLLALPNIGVEFYLGRGISIGANWMYGWWSNNDRHHYWRAYGGEMNLRYWFGASGASKPLNGHHLGIYGGAYIYDFEFGDKGQMGGSPGKPLRYNPSYMAGVEYGYSLPVTRRLNIDFSVGLGYFGGKYYEYQPVDNHYVWLSTKRRNLWGPTKAEISLVWLIGHNNINRDKDKR